MKTLLAIAALAVAAAPSAAATASKLARFSLPYGIFGEGTSYADLRIGPDGKLYRLSTSPTNGVTISRYSLQP